MLLTTMEITMNKELILIKVNGPDKPGITYTLLDVISQGNHHVKDMGQSVTHGLLSLSILLEIDSQQNDYPVIKDLLFAAKKLGLSLDFETFDSDKQMHPTRARDNEVKFILNIVSTSTIPVSFLKETAQTFSEHNVNIHRIDTIDPANFTAIEITTSVSSAVNWDNFKERLISISNKFQVDAAFIRDDVWRRNKRLIVFDMDSTLIQTEVIDEMAAEHGVGEQVKEITNKAMNGELNFDHSLVERVKLLEGLSEKKLNIVLDRLEFTPGAEKFIKTVQSLGYKVAVISGGFTFFAEKLKSRLGLDYAFANELDIRNGELTGEVKGTIVNADQKATLVRLITQQEGIKLEQVVAIGDGANDLPMLSIAGLGIAYHAKDIVRQQAHNHMSHGPMTTILHFLGVSDQNFIDSI